MESICIVVCTNPRGFDLLDCKEVEDVKVMTIVPDDVYMVEESVEDLHISKGAVLMRDTAREAFWRESGANNIPDGQRERYLYMNVWRDGVLSARRGAGHMQKKAGEKDIPLMRQVYKLLDHYMHFLFSFEHKDKEALQNYETEMQELGSRIETGSTGLKAEIKNLIASAAEITDIKGRPNQERLPLEIAAAQRRVTMLLRHLRRWELDAKGRLAALNELCDSTVAESEAHRSVAIQAMRSKRLLEENEHVDNKDNAAPFWRQCAERLRQASVRPFHGFMLGAAMRFDHAAQEVEKDDGSGLANARHDLMVAELLLRIPRLMDELDEARNTVASAIKFKAHTLLTDSEQVELKDVIKGIVEDLTKIQTGIQEIPNGSRYTIVIHHHQVANTRWMLARASLILGQAKLNEEDYKKLDTLLKEASQELVG